MDLQAPAENNFQAQSNSLQTGLDPSRQSQETIVVSGKSTQNEALFPLTGLLVGGIIVLVIAAILINLPPRRH